MPKAIVKQGFVINVIGFIITSNHWEFFVTEYSETTGKGLAYVMGYHSELGSFDRNEIASHILLEAWGKGMSSDPESNVYIQAPENGRWISDDEAHFFPKS